MNYPASHSPATAPGEIGWEVRPARTDDVPAVAAAVAALLTELGGTPPARAAIESEARAHIDDPALGIVLVVAPTADDGNDLIGVLTASWARAIQVAGRLLTIEVLWTEREWRDRGVGAALVEALAVAAAAEGAGRVEVGLPRESFPALRATERFYLANGFERLGPRMRRAVP
ncbi:MAG TPA: GNAT family N-acetyltransferase [Solirubrobacterales bacterium]|jgi:GNAT superfamily N-acetyltransferase